MRQCKLHHCVGPAATVEQAIAVPILTPEHLWGTFQAEAEEILMVNGSFEGNDRERKSASMPPTRNYGWPTTASSGRDWRRLRRSR